MKSNSSNSKQLKVSPNVKKKSKFNKGNKVLDNKLPNDMSGDGPYNDMT